ncbi:P-loop containing nucleoside triphosphate hydrolase protein [Flagelloscypha sp. PMI_526]|nr:P-loop containing nucleoside triphosphate hydrolase protein [Flagelloscypha sp. PMI_526]KAH8814475.1 P-loop containing nucleoside triphosphate hydrolase protein [Flagelloscypha sp. PMI_526]
MYHLLKGLHEYLTRKEEFSVIIVGLDGAGKTTLLEKIKALHSDPSSFDASKIAPTVGQNTGSITFPGTVLRFWDLGGQQSFRPLWQKYYSDAHAVVFVLDAEDRERMSEGWEVFDSLLTNQQILSLPLLLLANKQDSDQALKVTDIRTDYEEWYQRKLDSSRRHRPSSARPLSVSSPTGWESWADAAGDDDRAENALRRNRLGSLDVMGVSALKGTGVREAIDWLFLRVQNSGSRS